MARYLVSNNDENFDPREYTSRREAIRAGREHYPDDMIYVATIGIDGYVGEPKEIMPQRRKRGE